MRIKITYNQLTKLIESIGFQMVRTKGPHIVYSYKSYDAIVVLKRMKKNELVPESIFAVVKRTIIEKGILSKEELYEK